MRHIDGVAALTLYNITADDSGKYIIMVENEFGMDCHFASLSVEGKNWILMLFIISIHDVFFSSSSYWTNLSFGHQVFLISFNSIRKFKLIWKLINPFFPIILVLPVKLGRGHFSFWLNSIDFVAPKLNIFHKEEMCKIKSWQVLNWLFKIAFQNCSTCENHSFTVHLSLCLVSSNYSYYLISFIRNL